MAKTGSSSFTGKWDTSITQAAWSKRQWKIRTRSCSADYLSRSDSDYDVRRRRDRRRSGCLRRRARSDREATTMLYVKTPGTGNSGGQRNDEAGNLVTGSVFENRPTNPLPDGAEIVDGYHRGTERYLVSCRLSTAKNRCSAHSGTGTTCRRSCRASIGGKVKKK